MTNDSFDDLCEQPQPPSAASYTYAILPEGQVDVEIVAASIGDIPWKACDANPTGTCLKLRLSAGRQFAFVFCDLPKEKSFLFKALAEALGMTPGADGKVSIGPVDALVGRRVRIEVGHYQGKNNERKACVRRWVPAAASPAAPQAPKPAKTTRSTKPQWDHEDDIPF